MMGSPSGMGFMEIMEKFIEASANVKSFTVVSYQNRTSQGYLEYIFRRAARDIFGMKISPETPLEYV